MFAAASLMVGHCQLGWSEPGGWITSQIPIAKLEIDVRSTRGPIHPDRKRDATPSTLGEALAATPSSRENLRATTACCPNCQPGKRCKQHRGRLGYRGQGGCDGGANSRIGSVNQCPIFQIDATIQVHVALRPGVPVSDGDQFSHPAFQDIL